MHNRKTLFLFRHAKSDWDAHYTTDHQRPLSSRGISAAKTMGLLLAQSNKLPDLVICSTATRARQTYELAAKQGNWHCDSQFSDLIYESHSSEILELLQQMNQNLNSVMLVGHEPTWSGLTSLLIGGGNIRFPTAAIARIDFYANDWRNVNAARGELRWLLQPRFFKHVEEN